MDFDGCSCVFAHSHFRGVAVSGMVNAALLVIDVQQGLLSDFTMVHDPDGVLTRLNALVTRARCEQVPLIFIQHNGGAGHPLEKQTAGWAIHPATGYQAGDVVVEKRDCDAFQNTDLKARLDELGVSRLIIAGMCSDYCVDTTVRRAYSLGYDVTLVSDAHTTINKDHMPAELIVRHHNAILGSGFAKSQKADSIDFAPVGAAA
jgi:nicotinamidase-related amidase